MADIAQLGIEVDSRDLRTGGTDLDRFATKAREADRATDGLSRRSRTAGQSVAAAGASSRAAGAGIASLSQQAKAAAIGMASVATAAASLRALFNAGQEYTQISNSLRVLGLEGDQVANAMARIEGVALRTRAPLAATAQLYQRISIAGKDLGASQGQILQFTENVGFALAQTGSSASEASGALLQLSQAMAGGTVRAEEFNSILEGAFPIAQAAANGIDEAAGSVGRLRQLVVDGAVSSEEFFNAILSQTDELRAAFETTVPTISGAVNNLNTAFTTFFGGLDNGVGITAGIAQGILFLADNLDRVAAYATTAAALFGGRLVAGMVAARLATFTLAGSMVALRGALLRTGIGALVVGAGELVYQFSKLVTATGGWGAALSALGDLAAGVWDGIKTSASAIGPALNAVWESIKAGFFGMLEQISGAWTNFLNGLAGGLDGIPGMGAAFEALSNSAAGATFKMSEYNAKASAAASASERLKGEASALASQGMQNVSAAATRLINLMNLTAASTDDGASAAADLQKALAGLNDELDDKKGAAGNLKKTKDAAKDLADEMDKGLGTAVDGVTRAFGDFLTGSIDSFADFKDAILNSFRRMLSDMIAMAAKNRIIIGLGFGGTGVAGSAAAGATGAAGQAGGGLGILGNIIGSAAGVGGAFLGGATGSISAFFGSGVSAGFGAIGAQVGTALATGTMTSIAAAVGAVAAPLLAVAAVFSFFKKKVTELDSGLMITVRNMDALIQTFRVTETKRFWGLSKKQSTSISGVSASVSGPLQSAVAEIQLGVIEAANVLGVASDTFNDFSYSIRLSTKGLSEDAAREKVEEAFMGLGNAFANMVPELARFTREGEQALEAITRLSTSLIAANDAMDLLGLQLIETSLKGANAASVMVDVFGSIEGLTQAVSAYWQAFYTQEERFETTLRRLGKTFTDLGLTMPQSREAFRELVEAIDTSTEYGALLYAELIGLAGAMDQVLPKVAQFSLAMQGLIDNIGGEIGGLIAASRENAQIVSTSARLWYRTAETLRDFLADLLNSDLSAASGLQSAGRNQALFQQAFELARGGDVDAAQRIPELARDYLASARAQAASLQDYQRVASQVQSQVNLLGGISELEGANDDVTRALYERQIEVLTGLGNFLQLEGLTGDDVAALGEGVQNMVENWSDTVDVFEGQLDALGKAIEEAKTFSFDDLNARLDVAIMLADAGDMPLWIRRLIRDADSDIRKTLDFILRRNDLTPDMRWIAVNSVSEHVKSLDFVVRQDLPDRIKALTLATTSELRKNIRLILTQDLDPATRQIALAGNSDLSRGVVLALRRAQSDPEALRLALGNIGSYAVNVTAALSDRTRPQIRNMILKGQGGYAAMIRASVENLTGNQRRILLRQQGRYTANIGAVLNADMPDWKKRLLINDATTAVRTLTVSTAFPTNLTDWQKALLEAINGGTAGRITLAGGFTFAPDQAFNTWYSNTTKNLIATPMATLSNMLDQLRVQVQLDLEQRERAASIVRLQSAGQSAAADLEESRDKASGLIDAIKALESSTRVDIRNGTGDALLEENLKGGIAYLASHVSYDPYRANITGFRDAFWADGGYEDQIFAVNKEVYRTLDKVEALRQQIRDLGGVPTFASGGYHTGGLRIVGEKGPELEATGPSRIFSNDSLKAMFGQGETVRELRALRAEVAALRSEQRQLGIQTERNTRKSEKTLRGWDINGQPAERVG